MKTLLEAIGDTPLVELTGVWDSGKTGIRILAKLEGSNPGGSVKDRIARAMVAEAVASGRLTRDKAILEPTSGNTGIGLAMVAAAMGFRIKLTMPACVSQERRAVLLALGAELELTPGCDKTDGAITRARHIMAEQGDRYFMPDQYANPENWRAHYRGTAPEIVRDCGGGPDLFVAGMGTSGTLMGCSRYFRDVGARTKVAGVEPEPNHRIQGLKNMGESIVPAIFEPSRLDARTVVGDEEAFEATRDLALREGLFCGISSGAALAGAMKLARDLPRGSTVAVIFPDRGDRYLSTEVFRSVCSLCPP